MTDPIGQKIIDYIIKADLVRVYPDKTNVIRRRNLEQRKSSSYRQTSHKPKTSISNTMTTLPHPDDRPHQSAPCKACGKLTTGFYRDMSVCLECYEENDQISLDAKIAKRAMPHPDDTESGSHDKAEESV